MSALARIEIEDARVELERAHEAAKQMGLGAEGEESDDDDDNNDDGNAQEDEESSWVELVYAYILRHMVFTK